MHSSDTAPFVALLADVFGVYPASKPLSEGQVTTFFRALAAYPLEVVRAALDAHVRDPQRGRYPPVPADVIAQIEAAVADDGRPGADEAWAIAVRAADEAATVVWCDEIAQAWGAARAVIALGDEVGARVAFRDTYTRLVDEARKARRAASWTPSLGHDIEAREAALKEAVAVGRLPASEVLALAPPKVTGDPLLTLVRGKGATAVAKQRLQELREALAARDPFGAPDEPSADYAQKLRTRELQQQASEAVQAFAAAARS